MFGELKNKEDRLGRVGEHADDSIHQTEQMG
jgi:hypothetical protein